MITIGIRDLKARLSQVLREVRDGETVLITDRGRVVAEMHRPETGTRQVSPLERALGRLAADGHLRVAEGPLEPYERSPLSTAPGTAQEILDEARGEL